MPTAKIPGFTAESACTPAIEKYVTSRRRPISATNATLPQMMPTQIPVYIADFWTSLVALDSTLGGSSSAGGSGGGVDPLCEAQCDRVRQILMEKCNDETAHGFATCYAKAESFYFSCTARCRR